MTKKQQSIITMLSVLIVFLLLLISRRLWFRLDLTANKAYTLAAVSRNLGNEIDDPVRVSYFISGKLLSIDSAPSEITDILREYEARSRGKIVVTVKDPGKDFSEPERYGLVPQQLQNVEQDEASFSVVYSGIVIEYLNKYEVIPWVFSLDSLEYDVTSRIRSLVSGRRREIGVIAPEPQKTWKDYYGYFDQALVQSGFTVLQLQPGEEIPDTLPGLIVLGGAEILDEYSLYRIDRYIQLGGRVFFSVESVDVNFFSVSLDGRLKNDKGLLAMISFYGATLGPSLVLDRAALLMPYRDYSQQLRLVRYPPWIGVLENQANKDHPLCSGFAGLDLFWASPITFTLPESGKVRGEVLFTSTPKAWLMSDNFSLGPEQSPVFALGSEETEGEKILAVALEGIFPSWFEGAEKPRRQNNEFYGNEWDNADDAEDELPAMPSDPKEARIVVIGDSDMGGPLIRYTQPQQSVNLNFLLQVADWLGKDDDIIGIRNRSGGTGRLDRITDDNKRLGVMKSSRILNIFIVPSLIAVFGITRLVKRNYKKERDRDV
ncbi:MAG: GldG family protein [Treponema sp.]|nr:GldG family protein [Treponema sp.]